MGQLSPRTHARLAQRRELGPIRAIHVQFTDDSDIAETSVSLRVAALSWPFGPALGNRGSVGLSRPDGTGQETMKTFGNDLARISDNSRKIMIRVKLLETAGSSSTNKQLCSEV